MSDLNISAIDRPAIPGSESTVREIMHQPEVWAEAAESITAQRHDLDDFLVPILRRADLRIILTGAGTSAFVGEIAAPALSRQLGRRVDAVSTTDIVSNPRDHFAEDLPTLLVSFARSGNSPESIAATRLADECLSDVRHLIITCDETGALYKEHTGRPTSKVLLMPDRANDQGFAMTSSFTSMLLTCLLAFGPEHGSAVDALAAAASEIIVSRYDAISELAARGFERVVYLGSGPLTGLARESALKLLELTAGMIVTYYDSALGFRHGPKAVINDRTLVIVYVSSDPYTRRYDLDIIAELQRTMKQGSVLAIASEPIPTGLGESWVFRALSGLTDELLAVSYIVVAQILGLSFALQLGTTPDNPFPSGDVNRVVTGVTIHPLSPVTHPGHVGIQP